MNCTSAQLGYTVPLDVLEKNGQKTNKKTENTQIYNPKNNAKYSKAKPFWFGHQFMTLCQKTRWAYSTTLPEPA